MNVRQYNGRMKKDKESINDLHNITKRNTGGKQSSKMNVRQSNGKMKKDKESNNDLHYTTKKTKD